MSSSDRISLKKRVFNASAWSLGGYGLTQAIRFASNLVLTRLLVPETFGVMSIAQLLLVCLVMLTDFGFHVSLIQSNRGGDPLFVNTIWVTQIVRGVLLWFVALAISLFLIFANKTGVVPKNGVYADPSLPYVIAITALSTIIRGAQSTKLYEASRELSLGRITRIEILSQVAGLLLLFGWLVFNRSIWALVASSLCSAIISTLLSHIWLPGIANRWEWDRTSFNEILNFGKWIFLSSLLGFFAYNSDRFLLAGIVSVRLFGIYVIAYLIFSVIDQVLNKIISDVSFAALSEVARERPAELTAKYYGFYVPIALFSYFCSGFLLISGPKLIGFLYDPRYAEAGWILQIFALALLTGPLRLAAQSFLILGMGNVHSYIHAARLVSLYVGIPLGVHFFGFPGGVWATVLAYFSTLPLTIAYAAKTGLFDIRKELVLLPAILVGVIVAMIFNVALDQISALLRPFALFAK